MLGWEAQLERRLMESRFLRFFQNIFNNFGLFIIVAITLVAIEVSPAYLFPVSCRILKVHHYIMEYGCMIIITSQRQLN